MKIKTYKKFESIVNSSDLVREVIEGEPFELIHKYLKKYHITSKKELYDIYNNRILDIIDIWNEIKYDFPEVEIDYKKYNTKLPSYYIKSDNDNEPKKYLRIIISKEEMEFGLVRKKELSLLILESIERCKSMGNHLDESVDVRRSKIFDFNLPPNIYRYYRYGQESRYDNGIKFIYIMVSKIHNLIYNDIYYDINQNLRSELREIGYGLITGKTVASTGDLYDIPISIFKLKQRNEDED